MQTVVDFLRDKVFYWGMQLVFLLMPMKDSIDEGIHFPTLRVEPRHEWLLVGSSINTDLKSV